MSGSSETPRIYRYREAANGFFEFPTENARAILPAGLQPVEPHHGQSVLAVTAFDFHESSVGSYREIVLSILVAPRILPGEPMPRAAMYPFQIATTTPASRQHGIEVWRLPHYMQDVEVDLRRSEWEIAVAVSQSGRPILNLTVTGMPEVGWQTGRPPLPDLLGGRDRHLSLRPAHDRTVPRARRRARRVSRSIPTPSPPPSIPRT